MTPEGQEAFQVVRILRVRIQPDRAIIDVVIHPDAPARTTPELAQRAVELRPQLPHHACVNQASRDGKAAPLFGQVIDDTPLPHLLEHLAIDVLTERMSVDNSPVNNTDISSTFVGTSEWTDRAARTACIQLSCPDDLVVLRAFAEASQLLNRIVVG